MGHGRRCRDRGRSSGPSDRHADPRFPSRLRGFCRETEAGLRGQLMADRSFLAWPFFEPRHRDFAAGLEDWARKVVSPHVEEDARDIDGTCRLLVRLLGESGWLKHTVTAPYGGLADRLDVRTLCLARDVLARHSGLADFAFAMQGLGSGPITLFGNAAQKRDYLEPVRAGRKIAAFALTEPAAGSDVAALALGARADGDDYVLNG